MQLGTHSHEGHAPSCNLIYPTVGTYSTWWAWQIRPSQRMYDALLSIWRAGSFRHNFAEDDDEGCEAQRAATEARHYPGDQNVHIEYFSGGPDRYHVLDPCYNYRGRISEQESCGQCADQVCDHRIKVLHIAKLLKVSELSQTTHKA